MSILATCKLFTRPRHSSQLSLVAEPLAAVDEGAPEPDMAAVDEGEPEPHIAAVDEGEPDPEPGAKQ